MKFREDAVNKGVNGLYDPINPVRVARRQLIAGFGSAVLVIAALATDGPLSWALWIWVGYRAYGLAALLAFGGEAAAERERRLRAIPPPIWAFLRSGKWSESEARR